MYSYKRHQAHCQPHFIITNNRKLKSTGGEVMDENTYTTKNC